MNLKQRYRGSIYRRTIKFIITYSFLFIMLFYTNTYSKFATTQAISPQAEVAKWEVEVTADGVANNTTIVLVPDSATSVNGKIYPGSTGYFDIVVNPNNTEVSINYIISFSDLPNGISLTTYEFLDDSNHTQYAISNNTISELISLNSNRETLSSLDSKALRIHWVFNNVLIDLDELSGDEELVYSVSVSALAKQSFRTGDNVKVKYVFADEQIYFNGNTCLDTNIGLFSNDNINRDFELTLDIDQTAYNTQKGAYVSCMDHSQVARDANFWPGFIFRTPNVKNSTDIDFVRRSSPSNTESVLISNQNLHNIKLIRTGTILYYDFNNSGEPQSGINYSDLVYAFDSPLKFGSDFSVVGVPTSFCTAIMSNITLQTQYSYTETPILPTPTRTDYIFAGWYSDSNFMHKVGDGGDSLILPEEDMVLYAKWIIGDANGYTNSSYEYTGSVLATHFYPFIEENIHKNFEIYFEIENMSNLSSGKYILSSLNSNQIVRIWCTSTTNIRISSAISNQTSNITANPTNNTIRIIRIDDKIYWSINGSTLTMLCNMENFTNYSQFQIVIGGTLNAYGKPNGHNPSYSCTFNNIRLRYLNDNATLQDFE